MCENVNLANSIVLEVKDDNDIEIAKKYEYVAKEKYPELYKEFSSQKISSVSFLEKLVLELIKTNQ